MLQKKLRLRKDHWKILKYGARRKSNLLTVFYLKNGFGHSRISISISKKCGGAVLRNRIRRRLKYSFCSNIISNLTGFDILVIPSVYFAHWSELTYNELSSDIIKLLSKL